MHQSVATISSPEFINLQPLDINPLMSSCEIKVLYVGENRNHSFISKDVASEMAKTLRGAPIVGYYKESAEDFGDHGEQVIIDDEGVKFKCLTKPYGFVSPDAKVWFKKFNDADEFGNEIEREYLMTTGYLWTGQFEECKMALEDEGRPHSMELDPETLDGHWAENFKNGMDFFIINDATFSKLCILGENVEPCFEGSSITSPKISSSFSLDDEFKYTLFTMMQDLRTALGGNKMEDEKIISTEEVEEKVESEFVASKKDEEKKDDASEAKNESAPAKKEEEEKSDNSESADDSKKEEESKDDSADTSEEDDKKKKIPTKSELVEEKEEPIVETVELEKFTALQGEFNSLQSQYSALREEVEGLRAFKTQIENKEKDELIESFYMLDDVDKKEFIDNKEKYTYDEIKKELSVICFDKKVSFTKEQKKEEAVTFDLHVDSDLPEWVQAVKEVQSNI